MLASLLLLLLAVPASAQSTGSAEEPGWQPLFDGKSLAGWREIPFTNRGPVRVEDGSIVIGPGKPMTGISRSVNFPKVDYEIRWEGMRRQGNDFFATLTFPVGESFCTWVTGGWGGDIVGLSSIDGWDAADNETRRYFTFENERWYRLRLQVRADRIRAWIDDRQVINVSIEGRTVGLRPGETKLMAPLGFASYSTMGAIRKVEYRSLAK